MPVIELGDLEDAKRTVPSAPPPRARPRRGPPAKSGDLAGPVKVWK